MEKGKALRETYLTMTDGTIWHPAHVQAANTLQDALELAGGISNIVALLAGMTAEWRDADDPADADMYDTEIKALRDAYNILDSHGM